MKYFKGDRQFWGTICKLIRQGFSDVPHRTGHVVGP